MKKKIPYAWMFFLNSNNYYIYMLIGAYYDLLKTKTKYPIYCAITADLNAKTKSILEQIGINTIEIDTDVISKTTTLANVPHYRAAFSKLAILGKDVEVNFDKIVYLDTDMQFFDNIDELMEKPHMSAIADEWPSKDKTKNEYHTGDSIFCSGLFVWDFKNNPGVGQNIIDNLSNLDKNVGWHDQAVLNFYYKNWQKQNDLHLSATYGVMNDNFTIKKYIELYGPAKAIHYVSRPRSNWPFKYKLYAIQDANYRYSKWVHVKKWLQNINEAIDYFKLPIEKIHVDNICFISEAEAKAQRADGQPNAYLYF